ncbi:MAG: phospholipase D-like domain-containing protein [Vulcanimicrobiaceae bacterium]
MKNSLLAFTLATLVTVAGCAALLSAPPPAPFASFQTISNAISRSRHITLSAYTLDPHSPLLRLLATRARHGASVHVILTGHGYSYALRQNCAIVRRLAHSADCEPGHTATLGNAHVTITRYPLHLKALLADREIFVTDTNFSTMGLYLQLAPALKPTVLKALHGAPGFAGGFTTEKARSLAVEAAIIATSHAPVSLETESIGPYNRVFAALLAAAHAGQHVTVLINARDYRSNRTEHVAVRMLSRAGVIVQRSNATEKITVVGHSCWFGSSNASDGLRTQIDWGARFNSDALCSFLARRLAGNAH